MTVLSLNNESDIFKLDTAIFHSKFQDGFDLKKGWLEKNGGIPETLVNWPMVTNGATSLKPWCQLWERCSIMHETIDPPPPACPVISVHKKAIPQLAQWTKSFMDIRSIASSIKCVRFMGSSIECMMKRNSLLGMCQHLPSKQCQPLSIRDVKWKVLWWMPKR